MRTAPLFTTSWDDGHPLDVRVAAVLDEFGFVGTFYSSTGPEGRRLVSDEDLALIGQRHELGVHGRTHTIFPELARHALAEEIEWAASDLSRFGTVPKIAAPPRGKIDPATRRFLGHLGYIVRTGAVVGGTEVRANALEPSFQLYPHRWRTIVRNYAYRRMVPSISFLLAIGQKDELGERFGRLVKAAARHRRYVHFWGHAADIERLGLWSKLRELLGVAAELRLTPVSNSEAFKYLSRSDHRA